MFSMTLFIVVLHGIIVALVEASTIESKLVVFVGMGILTVFAAVAVVMRLHGGGLRPEAKSNGMLSVHDYVLTQRLLSVHDYMYFQSPDAKASGRKYCSHLLIYISRVGISSRINKGKSTLKFKRCIVARCVRYSVFDLLKISAMWCTSAKEHRHRKKLFGICFVLWNGLSNSSRDSLHSNAKKEKLRKHATPII